MASDRNRDVGKRRLQASLSAAAAAEVTVEATVQALQAGRQLRRARNEVLQLQAQLESSRPRPGLHIDEAARNARKLPQADVQDEDSLRQVHRLEESLAAAHREAEELQRRLNRVHGEAQLAAEESYTLRSELLLESEHRAAGLRLAEAEACSASRRARTLEDLRAFLREAEDSELQDEPLAQVDLAAAESERAKLIDCEAWVELSCLKSETRLLREELRESQPPFAGGAQEGVTLPVPRPTAGRPMELHSFPGAEACQLPLAASLKATTGLKQHASLLNDMFSNNYAPTVDVVEATQKIVKALQGANADWQEARKFVCQPSSQGQASKRSWPSILEAARLAEDRVKALNARLQQNP